MTTSNEIPEVENFLAIENRLDRLRAAHPAVFEQLEAISDEYNTALKAADKRLRQTGESAGPFQLTSTAVVYNAEKLYEELDNDDDRFLELGGKIEKSVSYSIDKPTFEAKINANKVGKAIIQAVRSYTYRYKKPSELKVR